MKSVMNTRLLSSLLHRSVDVSMRQVHGRTNIITCYLLILFNEKCGSLVKLFILYYFWEKSTCISGEFVFSFIIAMMLIFYKYEFIFNFLSRSHFYVSSSPK